MASLAKLYNDEKLVDDVSEFITNFLNTRFDGLPPGWRELMADVCIEMFSAGADWAENAQSKTEKELVKL